MTRDERQALCVQKWIDNKCCGTVIASVGFGKTYVALHSIKRFVGKNPTKKVLIIVPNEPLVKQWQSYLVEWQLSYNCEVRTMNSTVKEPEIYTDLLIVDEVHKCLANTLIKIFTLVKYKMILCLTATLVRVDGMHTYLLQFCPVVDTISKEEAIENGWISSYKEYKVLLDVDLTDYQEYNTKFYEAFSFFDYDFNLCQSMLGANGWKNKESFIKQRCPDPNKQKEYRKQVTAMIYQFSHYLQKRKQFIANHPKKIEITNKIISHFLDRKCITFSSTVKMAEKLDYGKVYSGKDSGKKGRAKLDDFLQPGPAVIHSIYKLNEGFNCPEASIGVILGFDSSQTKKEQRLGRLLRIFEGKSEAKIFTLVLRGTVEERWFTNSSTNEYTTIDEEGLDKLLAGEKFTPKKEKETQMTFRF